MNGRGQWQSGVNMVHGATHIGMRPIQKQTICNVVYSGELLNRIGRA